MFVKLTDYQGNPVRVDASRVIKIREAAVADEPKRTIFIDFASGGTFAKGTLKEIVHLFGSNIRLAMLHAPNGLPVYLNADGIAAIEMSDRYDGNCVAIVAPAFENFRVPARNKIALRETVDEAQNVIDSAPLIG